MLMGIIIVILLGTIVYLVLEKKNVKMDDVKSFLKDSGTKIKEESGPLFEKAKTSFASAAEEVSSRFAAGNQEGGGVPSVNTLPPSAASNESYFDGGLLQLIGWTILGFLVTALTFGICFPWAFTMKYGWETKHTVINGRRLQFDGTALQLFGNWIKWLVLTIITLGIYGFWLPIKLKKWRTKHTSFVEPTHSAAPPVLPTEESVGNASEAPDAEQPIFDDAAGTPSDN